MLVDDPIAPVGLLSGPSPPMNHPRLVPPLDSPPPIPSSGTCPACGRPDALRTARTETGRHTRCRFTFEGSCTWEGIDRPFRRPRGDAMPTAFVERLGRIAERVIEECVESGDGTATARIDPQFATTLRSAIRRAAREREVQVRTTHVGDGRVEVRLA